MRSSFLRASIALAIVLMVVVAGTAAGQVQASQPLQATATMDAAATMSAATMDAAATTDAAAAEATQEAVTYPPCPDVIPAPTAEATGAATAAASAATMEAAPAATADAAALAAMKIEPFTKTKGCTLTAKLSGEEEVPKKGPAKAGGDIVLVVSLSDAGAGTICYLFDAHKIKLPAAAAHIHYGVAGVPGPVVVPLAPPDKFGKSSGCTTGVPEELITELLTEPYNFYVNVHTSDFPAGAARGQVHSPGE